MATTPPLTLPVTVSFREDDRNPAHVRLSVFVGRNPGARGHAGTLTLRTDELDELRETFEVCRILAAELREMDQSTAIELDAWPSARSFVDRFPGEGADDDR